jgi:hypothetical protein
MIVRKYLERKGEGASKFSRERNKKDLRGEFRSEVGRGISTNLGLMKKRALEL